MSQGFDDVRDGDRPRDRAPSSEERLLHRLVSSGGSLADKDLGALEAEFDSEMASDADAARELRELKAFLSTCRDALQPEPEAVPGRLADRILARTTRSAEGRQAQEPLASEDPGWRGDVHLVQGFLRARWKASWLLRVAAASLVLHLGALPLLAYFGFVKEEPEFALKFAPRAEPAYVEVPEPEREVELDELGELPDARELPVQDGLAVQNAINWARFHLSQAGEALARAGFVPSADPSTGPGANAGTGVVAESGSGDLQPDSQVSRALFQRGSYLGRRATRERSPQRPLGVPVDVETASVARAVYVEHLMDRFVLEGRTPSGLAALLGQLGVGSNPALVRLERCALLRARSYGLLSQGDAARLEALLEGPDGSAEGWDALAPRAPMDSVYRAALSRAAGPELGRDPVGAAWLAATAAGE